MVNNSETRTILVVEERRDAQRQLLSILEELDLEIFLATSEQEAYTICQQETIDIFLIDALLGAKELKDSVSMSLARKIRQIRKYARATLIFISFVGGSPLEAYTKLHCFSYLKDPLTAERIRDTVEEAMELPRIVLRKRDSVVLQNGKVYVIKKIKDVVYAVKSGKTMLVHTMDGDVPVNYLSVAGLLKQLESDRFVQYSRNAILNMDYVKKVNARKGIVEFEGDWGSVNLGPKLKKRFLETWQRYEENREDDTKNL